ncbi:MAG: hypothetical protein Q8Q01_02515 [archaeon]|nr:hypothetical protein [archaeon]
MSKDVKEIFFDEVLRSFFYRKTNERYDGTRVTVIKSKTTPNSFSSRIEAEDRALDSLLRDHEELNVDAFEIVSSGAHDSRQEYDSTPFQGYVSAIFYSREQK